MPKGILPEVKLQAVKDYISGNGSYLSHANELGVDESVFRRWVNKYKASGESAFIRTGHNQSYSASFKKCVVEAYLNGEGSYRELAVTYNIPSEITIRQWVLKYNGHEKLKASGTGGIAIMTKGRKTTFDEEKPPSMNGSKSCNTASPMIIIMPRHQNSLGFLTNRHVIIR